MIGLYENFPQNIHFTEIFTSSISKRKLQEKLIHSFQKINAEKLSFEQIDVRAVPDCSVIFEFGIADTNGFNFLSSEEARKLQQAITDEPPQFLDWFCGIRYYKNTLPKKTPLKFDYYILRVGFGEKGAVEFLVFHERGPRYVSPQDLVEFIARLVNEESKRKILKPTNQR